MSTTWIPHDYQKKALEFVIQRGSSQLWLEPGLGKSSITLQAIKTLRDVGAIKKVLVIAPLRVAYSVWPEEITKWSNFEDLTITVLHGGEKNKRFKSDSLIHVINFDGLQWLASTIAKSGVMPYDMLVVDEISMLKNIRTQRFKSLAPLLDKFKRRVGLTGSPAPNSLMDIFGPQLVIDRGATFGRFVTHFRNSYFMPADFMGYSWKLQPGAEDKIHSALAGKVLRMAAADYLDMPEFIVNNVRVDMPESARKIYEDLEKTLLAEIGDGTVTAMTSSVALMKCHQVCNGAIYMDGPEREVSHVHGAKLEAVEDIVEELQGEPVLIAYHFGHDLRALKAAFPTASVIGSGVTGEALKAIVDDWNEGKIKVLLAHPQSAGHGLNLQFGGRTIIWYSNTYSLEHFDQFNRRLYRQGQTKPVIVHRIIARKTVDEAIIKTVDRKEGTQNQLMNAIRDYAKEAV
jgi:SNF2 family DNA or RNA helicase